MGSGSIMHTTYEHCALLGAPTLSCALLGAPCALLGAPIMHTTYIWAPAPLCILHTYGNRSFMHTTFIWNTVSGLLKTLKIIIFNPQTFQIFQNTIFPISKPLKFIISGFWASQISVMHTTYIWKQVLYAYYIIWNIESGLLKPLKIIIFNPQNFRIFQNTIFSISKPL